MTAKVLVIGLDAFEAPLAERWASEGLLPNLQRLIERGTSVALSNSMDTLPFGIWPEIASGQMAARSGVIFHARQLHTGEVIPRKTRVEERDAGSQFWAIASERGARACVIDIPQSVAAPGVNGVQVFEWGIHDRHVEVRSEPPSVLEDIRTRWGPYRVDDCDTHHGQTEQGYRRLLDDLLWGADAKAQWATELLQREDWDLFACCWSESHCIGHQLRHLADPSAPTLDATTDEQLRNSWKTIYQRIDAGIGRLIDEAGPDATVLVLASHGMGQYVGGYQLLPPLLQRLGLGPEVVRVASARRLVPKRLRHLIYRLTPRRAGRRILRQIGVHHEHRWLENPANRATAVVVGRTGGIRLNLEGREPFGSVAPGPEAAALIEELRGALLELRLPGTDTQIVQDVFTSDEAFGPDHHEDVPDLLVAFRQDIGTIEAAESERVGLLHRPVLGQGHPRTGDHTGTSRLWAAGPEIKPGAWAPPGDVLDVAPTILACLGIATPKDCDGTPIDLGAGSPSPPPEWRSPGGRPHAAV